MKKFLCLSLFLAFAVSLAWSQNWAVVVNAQSMTINTIWYTCPGYMLRGADIKVYGPFLSGSLGAAGGGLLDVAITPDSKYALVSNFNEHKIYRIDLSDPANPTLAGTLDLGAFAPLDIAISPNGQFAAITTGAGTASAQLVFVNLSTFANYSLYALRTSSGNASAVDIGKDNSTIVLCDYAHDRIIYGRVNAGLSGLVSESTLPTNDGPTNVAISPDGSTVLAACPFNNSISVFQITGPGTLGYGVFKDVKGFHDYPQSMAFNDQNGNYAYVVCSTTAGSLTTLSMLRIDGPGNVSMKKERAAILSGYSSGGGYIGVDTIIAPCSSLLLVGNPSSSLDTRNRVSYVFVEPNVIPEPRFFPSSLDDTQYDAKGIAIFSWAIYPPANASLSRLTNNYIFFKEYVNRLTWQANSKNISPIAKYRIYRKKAGDPESAYQQLAEVDGSTFKYDDRRLKKTDSYSYRITAITPGGLESDETELTNTVVLRRD